MGRRERKVPTGMVGKRGCGGRGIVVDLGHKRTEEGRSYL
jgi:hypothetical protein